MSQHAGIAATALFLLSAPIAAAHVVQSPVGWKTRHVALSDRYIDQWNSTRRLNNVFGCHSLGWSTDRLQCPWNRSSADPGSPCVSISPSEMLETIQSEPWDHGHDTPWIFTLDNIFDPSLPNAETWGWTEPTPDGYYTPFFDSWQAGLKLRVEKWFGAFKALGGRVDVVLLDLEACDYLNAGRSAHQKNGLNETNFGKSVVTMPQWPALRERLEAIGAQFGAQFSDADMIEMKVWRANQSDFRAYVWDSVVVSERTAQGLNASIAEPILKLFPEAIISNYAHNYYSAPGPEDQATTVNWGYAFNEERHSVAGRGAHVGTHASRSAYGAETPARNLSWWNASESGLVPPLTQSTPWWETSVATTPFNMMLIDVKISRNAKAAAPSIGYHPYFCPKRAGRSSTWHTNGDDYIYGDSQLWEEHLFHIVVSTGTKQVATWNFEFSADANILLSKCLHELDEVINTDPVVPLSAAGQFGVPVEMDAPFLVSGVELNDGSRIYRVTFRDPNVAPLTMAAGAPARFTITSQALIAEGKPGFQYEPVPGGTMVGSLADMCSTRGYWVKTVK